MTFEILLLQDHTICLELSFFDEDHNLIGTASKNITVNEINLLSEIDDTMSIELVDHNNENNIKLKFLPIILSQHPSKKQNTDLVR